jgi:hypothetical protein
VIHAGAGADKLIGDRGMDQLFGEADTDIYSMADSEADTFDLGLNSTTRLPTDSSTVTGDRNLDSSSIDHRLLGPA